LNTKTSVSSLQFQPRVR